MEVTDPAMLRNSQAALSDGVACSVQDPRMEYIGFTDRENQAAFPERQEF